MEEESTERDRSTDPICSIVKPEPRTIKPDQCSCKLPQPPEASSQPGCSRDDTSITQHKPDLSNLSFSSEPCPSNSDLSTKNIRKTRWTSSPPGRRDSGSAASGGSDVAGDSAAVCPDTRASSKPTDSPIKRRGNTTSFTTHSENVICSWYVVLTDRTSSLPVVTCLFQRNYKSFKNVYKNRELVAISDSFVFCEKITYGSNQPSK